MKKTAKIITLALVLVMAIGILASCGAERGTYVGTTQDGKTSTFEFSGSRFTYTEGDVLLEGTYSVKTVDGEKLILLRAEKQYYKGEELEFTKEEDRYFFNKNGVPYENGKDENGKYVVISQNKYYKR